MFAYTSMDKKKKIKVSIINSMLETCGFHGIDQYVNYGLDHYIMYTLKANKNGMALELDTSIELEQILEEAIEMSLFYDSELFLYDSTRKKNTLVTNETNLKMQDQPPTGRV